MALLFVSAALLLVSAATQSSFWHPQVWLHAVDAVISNVTAGTLASDKACWWLQLASRALHFSYAFRFHRHRSTSFQTHSSAVTGRVLICRCIWLDGNASITQR